MRLWYYEGQTLTEDCTKVDEMRRFITDEFLIALGLSPQSRLRPWLEPVIRLPVRRFAQMAVDCDGRIARSGLAETARDLLFRFVDGLTVCGAESIPAQGPLLLASNHPGAYDVLALLASVRRDDLKVVASGVDTLRRLPAAAQHMIYVTSDVHARLSVVRDTIRHLRAGGALLIFPTGQVDPDPELEPGSEEALGRWSASLSVILQRVPQARLLPAIVSGVLAKACLRNPIARLPRAVWRQRKLAEFLQVSQQLAFHRRFSLKPRISFGQPLAAAELCQETGPSDLQPAIVESARSLLAMHLAGDAFACVEEVRPR
jgi:hypothetical protein